MLPVMSQRELEPFWKLEPFLHLTLNLGKNITCSRKLNLFLDSLRIPSITNIWLWYILKFFGGFFFLLVWFFRAAPMSSGSSQARGHIRAPAETYVAEQKHWTLQARSELRTEPISSRTRCQVLLPPKPQREHLKFCFVWLLLHLFLQYRNYRNSTRCSQREKRESKPDKHRLAPGWQDESSSLV